ncbi:hypothetical protein [Salinicoccus kekensis]|uniref:Uncharacterized protein n=1 Tax=Salinicoccus kekensis TaxID=714307 RepID=A0A285UR43_9STAP|nr:hypothetical protein [Salinicoccus kekensis]SOC43848.1 hypothetical protein SAMN05878391_2131 [Salinicoccus kekensis]
MDNEEYESVSLIETPMDLNGRELVCYPYLIVLCKVSMPRMFMKPRVAWTVITVDLVKGVPLRSNMFPETADINIKPSALVPAIVSHEEAVKKARKLVLRWVMFKFHAFRNPEIEIVKEQAVYKAFFFAEADGREILVDTVKGLTGEDL